MSDSYILSEEEKLLIRKAEDKADLCLTRYALTCTGFLNEREQDILLSKIKVSKDVKTLLIGGYPDAMRRMMVFLPEYLEINEEKSPVCAVRASFYKDNEPSHRDFLGAILGLGISRDGVGDILIDKEHHSADIILKCEIKDFILNEFTSAGRTKLTLREIPLEEVFIPQAITETVTDTVASPRIDAITSGGFGISRENAAALIRSGKLYLNRRQCTDCSRTVEDGSLINASGYGKFKVFISDKVSKKGRIFINIEKYK